MSDREQVLHLKRKTAIAEDEDEEEEEGGSEGRSVRIVEEGDWDGRWGRWLCSGVSVPFWDSCLARLSLCS